MKEVVGTGIRVTEVASGFVETNFSVTRFRGDEAAAKKVYEGMQPCKFMIIPSNDRISRSDCLFLFY